MPLSFHHVILITSCPPPSITSCLQVLLAGAGPRVPLNSLITSYPSPPLPLPPPQVLLEQGREFRRDSEERVLRAFKAYDPEDKGYIEVGDLQSLYVCVYLLDSF